MQGAREARAAAGSAARGGSVSGKAGVAARGLALRAGAARQGAARRSRQNQTERAFAAYGTGKKTAKFVGGGGVARPQKETQNATYAFNQTTTKPN